MATPPDGHTPGMAGSVWFGGIVVVIGLVLAVVITPILFIPVGLILLLALFTGPSALIWHRVSGGRSGISDEAPSTAEATYDPVDRPDGISPRG
jgi:hypothetical protein